MANIAITLKELHNLFPFTNHEFFRIDKDLPPENNYSAFVATIIGDYKSPVAHYLYPATNQREINYAHMDNNQGGNVDIIDFKVDIENMPNTRMIFMLITQETKIPPENTSVAFVPHFLMTGFVSQQNDEEIFTPVEYKNLAHAPSVNNGELSLINAKERGLFFQSFAYAEEAFRRIAAGLPLNLEKQQQWLSVQKTGNAQLALNHMFNRTSHGLRFDINCILNENNHKSPYTFQVGGMSARLQ